MAEEEVGKVTHYFSRIGVAAVELTGTLRAGDMVHILGHTTDLTQAVESMQIEHETVPEAGPGQSVAFRVSAHVRQHDTVYRVT